MAFSATYTDELLENLEPLMKRPQRVMTCSETVSLLGVAQFYVLCDDPSAPSAPHTGSQAVAAAVAGVAAISLQPGGTAAAAPGAATAPRKLPQVSSALFPAKVERLLLLLSSVSFHQAAVFCNTKLNAEWLAARLTSAGYPAAYLSGDRPQLERMEAMEAVRGFKLRVGKTLKTLKHSKTSKPPNPWRPCGGVSCGCGWVRGDGGWGGADGGHTRVGVGTAEAGGEGGRSMMSA